MTGTVRAADQRLTENAHFIFVLLRVLRGSLLRSSFDWCARTWPIRFHLAFVSSDAHLMSRFDWCTVDSAAEDKPTPVDRLRARKAFDRIYMIDRIFVFHVHHVDPVHTFHIVSATRSISVP